MSEVIGNRPLNWAERRAIVLDRAGYECADCGGTATEADHKWPRSAGGTDGFDNLQALCRSCNAAKGDLLLIEHMTPARLKSTAILRLEEALTAAHQAIRLLAIADLLLDGWGSREAHDEVGVDPSGFPTFRRTVVAEYLTGQLCPDATAEVPA